MAKLGDLWAQHGAGPFIIAGAAVAGLAGLWVARRLWRRKESGKPALDLSAAQERVRRKDELVTLARRLLSEEKFNEAFAAAKKALLTGEETGYRWTAIDCRHNLRVLVLLKEMYTLRASPMPGDLQRMETTMRLALERTGPENLARADTAAYGRMIARLPHPGR